jgi:hypothetical protein
VCDDAARLPLDERDDICRLFLVPPKVNNSSISSVLAVSGLGARTWSARRHFVERTFQDAKSELGWAEFSARKYRAWEHHLALTAAALWFVAQTKLEWEGEYRRDVLVSARAKGASAACALDSELTRATAGGAANRASDTVSRDAGGGQVFSATRTRDGESAAEEAKANQHFLI